jgi:hypothetical protein
MHAARSDATATRMLDAFDAFLSHEDVAAAGALKRTRRAHASTQPQC